MKIEFEIKKPDYDKIVFWTIHAIIWSIVIGAVLALPSWIVGEPIFIPFAKWFDGHIPAMWLVYIVSALMAIIIYIVGALILWLLITIVLGLFTGIVEIGDAYVRYDKKIWMENHDNQGKCINCRCSEHNKAARNKSTWCPRMGCSCVSYEPLEFEVAMKMIICDTIADKTSGTTVVVAEMTEMDNRFCTECGKTFEIEMDSSLNTCTKCRTDATNMYFGNSDDNTGIYFDSSRQFKIEDSEPPAVVHAKKDKDGNIVIHHDKTDIKEIEVTLEGMCLNPEICDHDVMVFTCECGCNSGSGKSIFYQCQWEEHRANGKPHNSWVKEKPALPPYNDETDKLICQCNHTWGQHRPNGSCKSTDSGCDNDCGYFIEQKQKMYLNCPGCGEKGYIETGLDMGMLKCSTMYYSACKIWKWDIKTSIAYDRNGDIINE